MYKLALFFLICLLFWVAGVVIAINIVGSLF